MALLAYSRDLFSNTLTDEIMQLGQSHGLIRCECGQLHSTVAIGRPCPNDDTIIVGGMTEAEYLADIPDNSVHLRLLKAS